jgi:DNA-directed RNA polymerase specialized sigma24 family protein
MTTEAEVVVVQLARASRRANLFLRARGLHSQDRDDVIAAAVLWCWENRHNYSLTTTLDGWFLNAVKDAYKNYLRGEVRNAAESENEIPTGDTTQATVEALEAAGKLISALPKEYKKAAVLIAQGYTRAEIMERGVSHDTLYETRVRIKQLRRLIPDAHEYRRVLRAMPTSSDDPARAAPIDREMAAQLEFSPAHGKDCPACWRCKYFEGFLPGIYKPVRMQIQESEVRDAVRDTEARKIEIAEKVRNGSV